MLEACSGGGWLGVDMAGGGLSRGRVDGVVVGDGRGRCDRCGCLIDDCLCFRYDGDEQKGEQDGDGLHGGILSISLLWGE